MPRPIPTQVMHFTRVEHLSTIIAGGLLSDTRARASGMLQIEVGHHDIKARRRHRVVPTAQGGVVADYVPFYFAPRSPMLFVIDRGRVPTYDQGCEAIVYLVTSIQQLAAAGLAPIMSDRNAVLAHASFSEASADKLDEGIDWRLMQAKMWNDTGEEPDRKERRMAECLVHSAVSWASISEVVTKTDRVADEARRTIEASGHTTPVIVRPDWYF